MGIIPHATLMKVSRAVGGLRCRGDWKMTGIPVVLGTMCRAASFRARCRCVPAPPKHAGSASQAPGGDARATPGKRCEPSRSSAGHIASARIFRLRPGVKRGDQAWAGDRGVRAARIPSRFGDILGRPTYWGWLLPVTRTPAAARRSAAGRSGRKRAAARLLATADRTSEM